MVIGLIVGLIILGSFEIMSYDDPDSSNFTKWFATVFCIAVAISIVLLLRVCGGDVQ